MNFSTSNQVNSIKSFAKFFIENKKETIFLKSEKLQKNIQQVLGEKLGINDSNYKLPENKELHSFLTKYLTGNDETDRVTIDMLSIAIYQELHAVRS